MSDNNIKINLEQTFDESSAKVTAEKVKQSAEQAAASITSIEEAEAKKRVAIAKEEAEAKKKTLTQAAPPAPPSNGGSEEFIQALLRMQENIGKNVARLGEMEAALMRSNDRMIETSVQLNGSEEELDAFGQRMDEQMQKLVGLSAQFERAAIAADELATAISKGDYASIDDAQQPAQSLKSSYDELRAKMGELRASARELKTEMDGARQTMLEGVFTPAQAETVAQLNAQISDTMAMLRQLKENKVDVILDAEGNMHSIHDLTQSLTKLNEAKNAVSEVGGDVSEWMQKHKDSMKDGVDEIIASYEKLRKVEEKQAEQAAKAAEKQRASAEKKLEKLQEEADLEAASIEELTSRLAELKAARDEAQAAEATVDEAKYAEAIKRTTTELEKKLRAQERAEEKAKKLEKAQKRAGESFTQSLAGMIRAAATGTLTMRGLATAIRGIGAAIKTGLGPIGWIILLTEGLILVAQKAWEWLKKLWEDNAKAAEESADRQKKAVADAQKAIEDYNAALDNERAERAYEEQSRKIDAINAKLKERVDTMREALRLTLREAALTQEQEELEHRIALADLQEQKESGAISAIEYAEKKKELEDERLRRKQEAERDKLTKQQTSNAEEQEETVRSLQDAHDKLSTLRRVRQKMESDESQTINYKQMNALEVELSRYDEKERRWTRKRNALMGNGPTGMAMAAHYQHKLDELEASRKEKEAELARLRTQFGEQVDMVRDVGFDGLANRMLADRTKGKSTVSGEFDKLTDEVQKTVDALSKRNEELTKTLNEGDLELRHLPKRQEAERSLQEKVSSREVAQAKKKEKEEADKEKAEADKEKAEAIENQSNKEEERADDASKKARDAARDIRKKNKDKIDVRLDKNEDEKLIKELYNKVEENGDREMLSRILRELQADGRKISDKGWTEESLQQYNPERIKSMTALRGKDRNWWQQRFQQLELSLKLDSKGDELKEAADILDGAAKSHKETLGEVGKNAKLLAEAYRAQLAETKALRQELAKALESIKHLRK